MDDAGLGGIVPGGKPGLSVGELFREDAKALGKVAANTGIAVANVNDWIAYGMSGGAISPPDYKHAYYEPSNNVEKLMMRQGTDALGWAIPVPGVGRAVEKGIPRAIELMGSGGAARAEGSIGTKSFLNTEAANASLAKPTEEFASRSANIYDPQIKSARSIFDDYPGAVKAGNNENLLIDPKTGEHLSDPETGRLLYDAERRPLVAERVVGRSAVGGKDTAILPEEYAAATKAAIGQGYTAVEARALPKGVVGDLVDQTRAF
ncbi:hypothetical protein [Mesorhizobium sp. NZP2298]|uniref:hypothetical protein n=1 Tax=Mesorhizobium sp. NZP2298 TaxID=2483403 RepID=UPI0015558966|nr:hypothetical protein [Mesorhizobium sp. NZP2298]QKC96061.1 hypothetical protein EB231_16170 [Mesorhizobium sp. NZP2298]